MARRRTFLLASAAAAGALAIGWGVTPPRQRLHASAQPLAAEGAAALNGWLVITPDHQVTVLMARAEMGQGTHTGLAAILAEELDADWAQVRVAMAPIDDIYNNLATVVDGLPFHPDQDGTLKSLAGWLTAKTMREIGAMVTGGSSSIKDLWLPMREAGAHARALLVAAAAERWKVPAADITVRDGVVAHAAGQQARFGDLAADAARQKAPSALLLKQPQDFRLAGQPLRRIEAAGKLDGTARFGIDALPPGLLYASLVLCPTRGGKVSGARTEGARTVPGVRATVVLPPRNGASGGVAVIADTPFHAQKGAAQVQVDWEHGPAAEFSSEGALRQLRQRLDTAEGFAFHRQGDAAQALASAAQVLKADYEAPYLAHAALEPLNATAQVADGRCTLWLSTQVPDLVRSAVAKALGLDDKAVEVHQLLLGGGFGRRLEVDYAVQAALVAQAAGGAPVQTVWSRAQDIQQDFYRPACVARFQAGLDAQRRLVAWHNISVGQAIVPQVMDRVFGLPGGGPDKTTSEGAFDQPYEWPHAHIAHEAVDLPWPVGFWRSVGHSHQAFFKECFLDEVALAAGQDPVAFRAGLLQQHPRHLAVLRLAADKAGWGQPLPPAADGRPRARGVALHQSFGSVVAQVAEVSVGADKAIRVHRVVCAVDCGYPVNPNLIAQQMEGAVVFGLSAALWGEVRIERGQVQQSNYHDVPLLRIAECPVVETHIVPSTAPPEGVGEPGVPPIAPAVANALAALTGQRLRRLPLQLA